MLDSAGTSLKRNPPTPSNSTRLATALSTAFELVEYELTSLRKQTALQEAKIREIEAELLQAARLQRELMPLRPPQLARGKVTIVHESAGAISGDLIHTGNADKHHATFSVADAAGHGVAAALLAAFVHRAFRDAEFSSPHEPQQVLEHVNRILLDTEFSDGCFITAIHASFDETTNSFRWARGGAPYPILLRPNRPPIHLKSSGPLLGVQREARFEPVSFRLEPGDAVLIHTDGLDAILGASAGVPLEESDWFRSLNTDRLESHLAEVRSRVADHAAPSDDVTLLALQV
ncbi:MAG: serine/threonine-protein phosphatase [Planctomycetes bacterium]|nr:serine/threonine-protein phosphatase [Planctomycetota bacterium]MBI3834218.1 serine/threonine-protein phosphatase [Planctomycetota bacterium]